jgi:hypothetical protein
MPLKRAPGDVRSTRDAVHFPMEDVRTGKRVMCEADNWFLEIIGGVDDPFSMERKPGVGRYLGHTQTFLLFRDGIERCASEKYDNGVQKPSIEYVDVQRVEELHKKG